MSRVLVTVVAVLAVGCTPPAPMPPVPPDATDAALPMRDAEPLPDTPCGVACAALTRICGPQQPDCVPVFAHIEHDRLIREPSGKPLTCLDVASASTAAEVRALGVSCGR